MAVNTIYIAIDKLLALTSVKDIYSIAQVILKWITLSTLYKTTDKFLLKITL